MPRLFGVDISKELAKAMGPGLLPAKLIKTTSTTPDPLVLTEGSTKEQSYSCRGVVIDYTEHQIDNFIIKRGDRMVLLLGGTLPTNVVPTVNYKIEIEGARYVIVHVSRDPAAASYTCQVRV